MQHVSYPIALPASQVYSLLKDPLTYPEWSGIIEQIEPLGENKWNALTMVGPIPFTWEADDKNFAVNVTYQAFGLVLLCQFSVTKAQDDSAIINVKFSDDFHTADGESGMATMLQAMIQQDLENFTQWAGVC